MNEHDLSTGKREVSGGLERYTFTMPASFFAALARPNSGMGDVKQAIVNVYCVSPRPDKREILDVSVKIEDKTAHVTLIIQRGHYKLAQLVMEHERLEFCREEGYATCSCHPDTRHPIVVSSIPNYSKEL